MTRPPRYQRPAHDFKPGRVAVRGGDHPHPDEIAKIVTYVGSGKHKDYPAPHGEWTPVHRPGGALCAHFAEAAWPRLLEALREAIRCECVQWEADKRFPSRVWAFINGTLHEARITNQGTGEYHGFPLECESQIPDDPHGHLRNAPRVEIPVV